MHVHVQKFFQVTKALQTTEGEGPNSVIYGVIVLRGFLHCFRIPLLARLQEGTACNVMLALQTEIFFILLLFLYSLLILVYFKIKNKNLKI